MKNEMTQVLVLGMRKYDSFKDREGNEVKAGCTVTLGLPYSKEVENKRGYEFKTYTFRENIDEIFNRFKDKNFPFVGLMETRRENPFSSNIVIVDLQYYECE